MIPGTGRVLIIIKINSHVITDRETAAEAEHINLHNVHMGHFINQENSKWSKGLIEKGTVD